MENAEVQVRGRVAAGWEPVRDVFEENFRDRGEVGASLCITHDGATVVDLWGGTIDREGTPWGEDTVVTVFSSTKGGVALAAQYLCSRKSHCGFVCLWGLSNASLASFGVMVASGAD